MNNFSDILDLLRSMGLILAAVFYIAIVFWTYKDMRKRSDDPILIATATAVAMLPIVGVLVYLLLRPSEYLADVRERELEIRVMERELGRHERCPYCKSHIEAGYLSCPVCTTKLRQSCTGCDKPLDPRWVLCPFCEVEVPGGGRGGRPEQKPSDGRAPAPRASKAANKPARPEPAAPRERATRAPRETSRSTDRPATKRPVRESKPADDAKDDKTSGSSISTEPFGKD